jgi:hypothetical protein
MLNLKLEFLFYLSKVELSFGPLKLKKSSRKGEILVLVEFETCVFFILIKIPSVLRTSRIREGSRESAMLLPIDFDT